VVGAAFGTVVSAFVKDMMTPLLAAVVGSRIFQLQLQHNNSSFCM